MKLENLIDALDSMMNLSSKTSNFEQVENFLLNHPDKEYKTSRFVYYFKIIGDCAGIFRRATGTCTWRGRKAGDDEIIAYYHDGEF